MKIKSPILFSILLCIAIHSRAQYVKDMYGKVIRETSYTDVEGSPYLTDSWSKGTVQVTAKEIYKDIDIKYDQLEDKLLFKNQNGQAMEFIQPVLSFKITYQNGIDVKEELYKNGFQPIDGNSTATYYNVINDGNVKLIKRTKKTIKEYKAYSSMATKTIEATSNYYIVDNKGSVLRIKNDKKSLLSALSDKSDDVEKYISKNKLDPKKDTDLNLIILYYNQLKAN